MSSHNILSLNLHCLEEENIPAKQAQIAMEIIHRKIDIIFFQEVAQRVESPLIYDNVKQDNYAYQLQQLLQSKGVQYNLYYLPIKYSFNQYDEGLALLSIHELEILDRRYISKTKDYHQWTSRRILLAKLKEEDLGLLVVHFGWSDGHEVFEEQVSHALETLPKNYPTIIAGDFNVTPSSEDYQYIAKQGLFDTFRGTSLAFSPTHKDQMDIHDRGSKIDYIMTTKPLQSSNHEILFTENPVSDHYGIFLKIQT